MSTGASIICGHPEFGKEVQAAFPKLFEVLPRVGAALNDMTSRPVEKPEEYQRVILNLGLLAGVSMMELVTLAGHGFGQGAMKIARTLMETVINAEYLRQSPAELDAYLGWAWVEKNKDLAYLKENLKYLLPQLTKEDIETIEKEFQKVRPLFADATTGRIRSSWCRMNLADRATKVGLAPIYGRLNRLSSGFIHGTIGGLTRHFVLEEDKDRIAIPPSLNYCDSALISGHQMMCFMVETLAKTFGWTPVHPIETLVADFKYAWNITEPAEAAEKK
jgi:hypothetical protein